MKYSVTVTFFISLLLFTTVFSQPGKRGGGQESSGGSIMGKVLDSQTGKAVEYATVVLFKSTGGKQINGSITDPNGNFEIKGVLPGKYNIAVSFIGYEKKKLKDVELSSSRLDLGEIMLEQKVVSTDNVVVEGQRVPFSYEIDKKVINVDKITTATSGNAVDILENIPSVSVDVEGNVSLRGSGSFTVLIDGRPTVVDAQDALQQIPASAIQNIEIITNPSVKYDPEGVAGIINLVLKKNENLGLSGMTNLSAGLKDKYGAEGLFNYKTPLVEATLGLNYRKRNMSSSGQQEKIFDYQGGTSHINTNSDGNHDRDGYGLRGGLNFTLGENDVLGIGGRYHNRSMTESSRANYSEFSTTEPAGLFYINKSYSEHSGDSYAASLNFQHKFNSTGHEITADVQYESEDQDDKSISELLNSQAIAEGKRTTEGGPGSEFNTKIDYTLPFSNISKLESGLEGQTELSTEDNQFSQFDQASGTYLFEPQFSYSTKSRIDEYSVYSVFSNMIGNFGYQAGVRGEYTYRKIQVLSLGEEFNIDRWDFFPTLHFSYRLESGMQFIASYAKRIQRPRAWMLEPFTTWVDANTVHRGNPGLKPELIDSYELGFQTLIGPVSLSAEGYYRINNSKTDVVSSPYADDVTLQTFANIGKDYSLGTEVMASFDVLKLWSLDLMGNAYDYRLKSDLNGIPVEKSSFNWRLRMSNSIKLSSTLQLQLNGNYESPSVSLQERRKGSFMSDLALKKDLMDKQLSITLQVRDILGTHRHESTTESTGLYSFNKFSMEAPMVMLNLRYSINNFKQSDRKSGNNDSGEDEF
ncbi:MAG: TonB-dependent receptor [Ignavibacteria bacterium]|jgi:outer membrane receptor protein involved in Fe transport|nr:TonB-dependent receptor [Ignavibacteria bacterium]MCU7504921.1 TonB-dependent receptor [Ignavibacteria bacterium]MCU7517787.1 TonB-dependent receptor [Ignavibacteria bacterium]